MDDRRSQLHGALAVLAAPRRFDLLVLMLSGEDRSVTRLAEAVGLSQSCTTRHLQALARAGLVKGVRDGKRVVFRISPRDAGARAVLAWVSGGQVRAPAPRDLDRARERGLPRPRRRRPVRRDGEAIPRRLLEAAVRIESAVELEPLVAGDGPPSPRAGEPRRSAPESGRTSEPEVIPAWRRSDLEDFLL